MILNHLNKRRLDWRHAFTLMEVLVVAAIILMLAGAGTVAYLRIHEQAKEKAAKTKVKSIAEAVQAYKQEHDVYPQALADLTQAEGGKPAYLKVEDLTDPWGRPYIYDPGQLHPTTFEPLVYSGGATGTERLGNW